MGIKNLDINSDSQVLVRSMHHSDISTNMSIIISNCRYLLKKLEQFKIHHVFRDTNVVADALARIGNAELGHFVVYTSQPPFSFTAFHSDLLGTQYLRQTCNEYFTLTESVSSL